MTESMNWDWKAEKAYRDEGFSFLDEKKYSRYLGDKNKNEAKKTALLWKKIKECDEKIRSAGLITDTAPSGPICVYLHFGYTENYGYYALKDNGRGHYSLPYGLPSEDIDTAIMMIMRYIIQWYAFKFETLNYTELKNDYKKRFGKYELPYKGCPYDAEYCLSLWKVLFNGEIPKEVIEYYEACMNDISSLAKKASYIWKYNAEDGRFILV